jgi:hypothetical protein
MEKDEWLRVAKLRCLSDHRYQEVRWLPKVGSCASQMHRRYVGCPMSDQCRMGIAGTLAAQRYPTTDSILLRSYLDESMYTSVAPTRRQKQSIQPSSNQNAFLVICYFLSLVSLPTMSVIPRILCRYSISVDCESGVIACLC